jgi:miniconductance mechanosensitive channel
VSNDQILRVSNEDAKGQGLPLLLLAYLTETQDVPYRLLEAEIYEHALAMVPRFGLRVFQAPAGIDLHAWHNGVSHKSAA